MTNIAPGNLGVLFHKIRLDSPQSQPFTIKIERNRKHQTGELDTAESEKDTLATLVLEPAIEKERKDKTVKDVCIFISI